MADLLIVISRAAAAPLVPPLVAAAQRKKVRVSIFLTGSGAALASASQLGATLAQADQAVVCQESWQALACDEECMAEPGSQTDHSRMLGEAHRVISF